jgi:hypothetical protein
MAVVYIKTDQGSQITSGTGVPTHTAVAGDRYTDTVTGNTYQYTTSWQTVSYSAGGLTYFTEAQNTTAPNATVSVDSLTAVTGTTDGDFAIIPKGTGAIVAQIPDGTATGGNKRGARAVDLQTYRTSAASVASGVGSVALGYQNTASGLGSVAIGVGAVSSNTKSVSFGGTASGVGSFAAGNSGLQNTVSSGEGSIALGGNATADYSFTTNFSIASGLGSIAIGGSYAGSGNAIASASYCVAIGASTRANGSYSMAILSNSDTYSHRNRLAYGTYNPTAGNPIGSIQGSTLVVGVDTTTATPTKLGTYGGTAIPLILQNNNSVRFKGTIIGRQSGSTNTSSWDIDGFIQRGTTAATTTLLISNVNVVQNIPAWGTPTLTADTSNGGLDIKVIGAATTSIRWTCVFTTTEVVYV